jgi:hypothetical protein
MIGFVRSSYYKSLGFSGDDFDQAFAGAGNQSFWYFDAILVTVAVKEMTGGPLTPTSAELLAQLEAYTQRNLHLSYEDVTARLFGPLLHNDLTALPGTRFSVVCNDQPTMSAQWYKRLSDYQGPRYPLLGWSYGLSEVCGQWSQAPRQALPTLPASATSKVLVVQGEFDPQTGYEQAEAAVRAAPGVAMVSVDDSPYHGQYALSGGPCVEDAVNGFLVDNHRPQPTVCPGPPLPGENQVYPTPGPLARHSTAAAPLRAKRLNDLAVDVQTEISRMNLNH